MGDGTVRSIEAIRIGDTVLAYDESTGLMVRSTVAAVHAPRIVSHYLVINGSIRLTSTQPVLSTGGWVDAGQLKLGDILIESRSSNKPIVSIRSIDGEMAVYNLTITIGTYIANGVVVHNKPLPYTIEPCWNCGP